MALDDEPLSGCGRVLRASRLGVRGGRAIAHQVGSPAEARRLWAAADRRLVDFAAIVPLVNEAATVVTGPHVRTYAWNPVVGVELGQLAVR